MKNRRRIRITALLITILLAATVLVMVAGATNTSNQTPSGWIGEFDEWAGKRDMSAYNPDFTSAPIKRMDPETAKMYPGVMVMDPDMQFPPADCYVVENISTDSVEIKFAPPATEDETQAKPAPSPAAAPGFGVLCTIGVIVSGIVLAGKKREKI